MNIHSPDTSNTDRLVVAVPYIDGNNVPNERVLEMKETTDKTGEGRPKGRPNESDPRHS